MKMKIEIHVATAHSEIDAGCGVICTVTNGNENKCRRYGYAFGNSDKKLTSIKSIIVGLSSVRIGYRDEEVELYIEDDYVAKLLEFDDSQYTINPDSYVDDVRKMRSLFSKFANIGVNGSGSKLIAEARVVAETSMNSQMNSDTYTYNYHQN